MNKFLILALIALATAVNGNEFYQKGSQGDEGPFVLYKVKPITDEQTKALLASHLEFLNQPPVFIQKIEPRKSVYVLIHEDKVQFWNHFLLVHRIRPHRKGPTLVSRIAVKSQDHTY